MSERRLFVVKAVTAKRVLVASMLMSILASCVTPGGNGFRPDLNDEIIKSIKQGDTEASVIAKLGAPFERARFANLKAGALDYFYRDTWGYRAEMAIMIGDDGLVQSLISSRPDADRGNP